MKFETMDSPLFQCAKCGHEQSYFPMREAVEGGEPCNRCRENRKIDIPAEAERMGIKPHDPIEGLIGG